MTDRKTPRGTPGHEYAHSHIPPYVKPVPVSDSGPYIPDASNQVAHASPGNANTTYPSPYTGPGVPKADPPPVTPGVPEAPIDGKLYARRNALWEEVPDVAPVSQTRIEELELSVAELLARIEALERAR